MPFCLHLGRKTTHLDSNASGFSENAYLSKILKAGLGDIKFPRVSTLLQCVNNLLLWSPSQASSQEDNIHFLKLLALKGHKADKEKLEFAQTQVQYLGHLIPEQELHLDHNRLHGILSFPKPKTKHKLWGFLQFVGYCPNWIQISLLWPSLYMFYSTITTQDPVLWEEWDHIDFKALKMSLMNPTALGHPNDQIPFFFLHMKRKGMPLGCSFKNLGTTIDT